MSGSTFSYDIFNRLISATPSGGVAATLAYDPAGRLHELSSAGASTRFLYDGAQMIAEYNSSNVLQRRYVFGPGIDEPIVWYEGAGTTDRRTLVQDERGSVIAITNASGAATNINSYDEFGQRGASNTGRFQYTGQAWLNEAGVYHYRARAYLPALGRFAQTDPIGFSGGMNLYAYVGNDPINFTDPFGLEERCFRVPVSGGTRGSEQVGFTMTVTMRTVCVQTNNPDFGGGGGGGAGGGGDDGSGESETEFQCDLVSVGNFFVNAAEPLAKVSAPVMAAGAVAAVVGLAAGPEGAVPGITMMRAGAAFGTAAAASQFVGGLLEGAGGAGWDNAQYAAGPLIMGGMFQSLGTPYGARAALSVRERAIARFADRGSTFTGGVYDLTVSALPPPGPQTNPSCAQG